MIHNKKNVIILNNAKQYILKNTIAKFGFSLKILTLYLYIVKYKANSMFSLYRVFKKTKAYFDMLNAKAQMQKKHKLKSGYEAFKSCQARVALKQNF